MEPPSDPPPLRGVRLVLGLLWISAVVLLHLAVRELGVNVVP